MKVKNVRPGILIIADAGLKLAPGESRDVEQLTPQTKTALASGMLAQMDKQDPKPAGKAADKTPEAKPQAKTGNPKSEKGAGKSEAAKPETTETGASESTGDTGGSGDPAQQSLVEVESGDK